MEEHKKHAEHHKHKAHEHRHTGSKNTNTNMTYANWSVHKTIITHDNLTI